MRAIDTTPFGCYPSMLLDVYEGTVGWSETDMRFVEKGWRRVQEQSTAPLLRATATANGLCLPNCVSTTPLPTVITTCESGATEGRCRGRDVAGVHPSDERPNGGGAIA